MKICCNASNCAKASCNTRLPLPKHCASLDQIKLKENKSKVNYNSTSNNGNINNLNSSSSNRSSITSNNVPNELWWLHRTETKVDNKMETMDGKQQSVLPTSSLVVTKKLGNSQGVKSKREIMVNWQAKGKSERSHNRPLKPGLKELKSPSNSIASVDEFKKRFSESKQVSVKIRDFYSLFDEKTCNNNESRKRMTSTSASATAIDKRPVMECIQSKLLSPKSILRRSKEPVNPIKEGHETSWVHMGFNLCNDFIEKSTVTTVSTPINNVVNSNHRNGRQSVSSDSNSSEDEFISIEGKKRFSFHQRLLALHRLKRQRKRALNRYMGMGFLPRIRASIVDRLDFYHRYGDKEQEALAAFNFLDELPASPSLSGSNSNFMEEQRLILQSYLNSPSKSVSSPSLSSTSSSPSPEPTVESSPDSVTSLHSSSPLPSLFWSKRPQSPASSSSSSLSSFFPSLSSSSPTSHRHSSLTFSDHDDAPTTTGIKYLDWISYRNFV